MNTAELYLEINKVCPISGITVGQFTDRNTAIIHYLPETTGEEKAQADIVVANAPFPLTL